MKNKLWSDLKTDKERIEFLQSGRAWETGIIAQAIVKDIIEVFKYRDDNKVNTENSLKEHIKKCTEQVGKYPKFKRDCMKLNDYYF